MNSVASKAVVLTMIALALIAASQSGELFLWRLITGWSRLQ
jgi:hypothetical protein